MDRVRLGWGQSVRSERSIFTRVQSRLGRRICLEVRNGPLAWSRIEALARRITTHHPDAVRRKILALCDAGVLLRWRLAQGHAVTFTALAAAERGLHLVEQTRTDKDTHELLVEAPRWARINVQSDQARVRQLRPARVPKRVVDAERRILRTKPKEDATKEAKAAHAKLTAEQRQLVNQWYAEFEQRERKFNEPKWLRELNPPAADQAVRLADAWRARRQILPDTPISPLDGGAEHHFVAIASPPRTDPE
jgi:hypothetical protein